MIGATIEFVLVSILWTAALLPVLAWLEKKHAPVAAQVSGAAEARGFAAALARLRRVPSNLRHAFDRWSRWPVAAHSARSALVVVSRWLPALLIVGVVPFGGTYLFGNIEVRLALADVPWGLLWVVVALALGGMSPLVAAVAQGEDRSALAALRGAALRTSATTVFVLAALAIAVAAGSLRLSTLAAWQDGTVPVLSAFVPFGLLGTELSSALDWLRLPRWGLFVQPVAAALALASLWVAASRTDPPRDDAFRAAIGPFGTGERLRTLVVAALFVTLFLGGPSLPYLSQGTIVRSLSSLVGAGAANAICLLLHVVVFHVKLAWVVLALEKVRARMSGVTQRRRLARCWGVFAPLALANLIATAAFVVSVAGANR